MKKKGNKKIVSVPDPLSKGRGSGNIPIVYLYRHVFRQPT